LTDLTWKYNAVFVLTGLLVSAIIYLVFELYEIDHKKYLKVNFHAIQSQMLEPEFSPEFCQILQNKPISLTLDKCPFKIPHN